MDRFELKLQNAQQNDEIVYYDYLLYKSAVGWYIGEKQKSWHRPFDIKKAKYNADFLQHLSNYYFLGFPIKELLLLTILYIFSKLVFVVSNSLFNA